MAHVVLCFGLQKAKIKVSFNQGLFQVDSRIQALRAVDLRSLFSCWLWAGVALSLKGVATLGLWPSSSIFKHSNGGPGPCMCKTLSHLSSASPTLCIPVLPHFFLTESSVLLS